MCARWHRGRMQNTCACALLDEGIMRLPTRCGCARALPVAATGARMSRPPSSRRTASSGRASTKTFSTTYATSIRQTRCSTRPTTSSATSMRRSRLSPCRRWAFGFCPARQAPRYAAARKRGGSACRSPIRLTEAMSQHGHERHTRALSPLHLPHALSRQPASPCSKLVSYGTTPPPSRSAPRSCPDELLKRRRVKLWR